MTATDSRSTASPAPARRRFKKRYLVAGVVCVAAVVWMITSLSSNLDYWKPVTAAIKDRTGDAGKHLRIGGLVVPGTVHGRDFQISDGTGTITVELAGTSSDAPASVKGCAPLVVAGRWQGSVLVADELTRRHGSEYSSKSHPLADDTPVSSCKSSLG